MMSLYRHGRLAAIALVVSLLAACAAAGGESANTLDSAGAQPTVQPAAALPAVDTQPAPTEPGSAASSADTAQQRPPTASPDSAGEPSTAQQDTTKPKPKRGLLGSKAGDRHMAYRDAGS